MAVGRWVYGWKSKNILIKLASDESCRFDLLFLMFCNLPELKFQWKKIIIYNHKVNAFRIPDSNEVFLWGENANSTLGHSSEQRRLIPTPVDTFRRQNLNIKQVCSLLIIDKIDSVHFLVTSERWVN